MDEDKNLQGEFSEEEIRDILKEALKMKIQERKKIPRRNQLNNALVSTLGEFLSCYQLIGYDLDGNPVKMKIYSEPIQKSALENAFMDEVKKFMDEKTRQ